jgi:hypothetical protein
MATKMTQEEKKNFIDFLSRASPEEMTEYIKQNGKNNSNDMLFVFQWDNLRKGNDHIQQN